MDIVIIDYGMGNLRNVQKAFEYIRVAARISSDGSDVLKVDGLVLPGVGAFGDAMDNLRAARLVEPILQAVSENKPLLGICVGVQLLFDESEEMGLHRGLCILPGRVVRFAEGLKVPHIGWNQLQVNRVVDDTRWQACDQTQAHAPLALLDGIADSSYAYFVHSYHVVPSDPSCILATTHYGLDFVSVVGQGNVFGAQFHPEKSQEVGLRLLENFARIVEKTGRRAAN